MSSWALKGKLRTKGKNKDMWFNTFLAKIRYYKYKVTC